MEKRKCSVFKCCKTSLIATVDFLHSRRSGERYSFSKPSTEIKNIPPAVTSFLRR